MINFPSEHNRIYSGILLMSFSIQNASVLSELVSQKFKLQIKKQRTLNESQVENGILHQYIKINSYPMTEFTKINSVHSHKKQQQRSVIDTASSFMLITYLLE